MLRVTIQDTHQTISFLTELPTILRLIAGCSINPKSLDELLIATDIYQRGLAASLMTELMDFDKALHRHGIGSIHHGIVEARQARRPFKPAFQVIDAMTEEESRRAGEGALILINLESRIILTSPDLEIPRQAEVRVQIGETETDRQVSYILPAEWKIEHLE